MTRVPASCRCASYECEYCRRKRFAKESKRRELMRQRRREAAKLESGK